MFTDTTGYTPLTQKDERAALRLVQEQEDLFLPVLEAHGGRKVKSLGDGFLIEFSNALDAVECGADLLRHVYERNARPDATPLRLRVGIHLGDVQEVGTDIFGDAVNIASRIEPLAHPEGVCISEPVFVQIRNKVPYRLESLGAKKLKGVQEPVSVYRVFPPDHPLPVSPPGESPGLRTRLAVLPFANIGSDPSDEFFADGLTEEMTSYLGRTLGLRVIARTSVGRYKETTKSMRDIGRELKVGSVLEGSVRRAGNRIRISVQLVDASSEEQLWTDRFDRELTDVFAIQDEITGKVSEVLQGRLASGQRLGRGTPRDLGAYTSYLQSRFFWNRRTPASIRLALAGFEEVVARDPGYAKAYSGIADAYWSLIDQYELPALEGLPPFKAAALRALTLDEGLAEAHASLGAALDTEREYVPAEMQFRRAIEIDPGYSPAHLWYSRMLLDLGRVEEAGREIARAEESDPLSPLVLANAGRYEWYMGRPAEALKKWDRALDLGAEMSSFLLFLKTLLHGSQQSFSEARACIRAYESVPAGPFREEEPGRFRQLAIMYASAGDPTSGSALLRQYLEAVRAAQVPADPVAMAYAALHQVDSFYEWAFRSVEDLSAWPSVVRFSPLLADVRADPRYHEYLRRCGVPV